jgi:hypothetical protein
MSLTMQTAKDLGPTVDRTQKSQLENHAALYGAASVRLAPAIVLTKDEVFEACECLAAAQQMLFESGHLNEAHRTEALFECLEGRLAKVA